MSLLSNIFAKKGIILYNNNYRDYDEYPDTYQDNEESLSKGKDVFETDFWLNDGKIEVTTRNQQLSVFSYFMDGTRKVYQFGDAVINESTMFPVVAAQLRAGCTEKDDDGDIHPCSVPGSFISKNILLINEKINSEDLNDIKKYIENSELGQSLNLSVLTYGVRSNRGSSFNVTENQNVDEMALLAIAKASGAMHRIELQCLDVMVKSGRLSTDKMLIVDGPLQFIAEDDKSDKFAEMFCYAVGVSKSFSPMLPAIYSKKKSVQIGPKLIKLGYAERTPVFEKVNSKGRKFGVWYLRIRPREKMESELAGIIKVEKMAAPNEQYGLDSNIVNNISLSLINEARTTCYGLDKRWPSHLYPVYLTERYLKETFENSQAFIYRLNMD